MNDQRATIDASSSSDRVLARLVAASCVATFAGAIAIFWYSGELAPHKWLNHDVANCLYVGEKVLAGDRLYIDWNYFVMPPIVLLAVAVSAIANLTGLSIPTVNHLVVIGFAGLGIAVVRDAWRGHGVRVALAAALVAALLARPGEFSSDFGQREHLFALLFLPLLVWRAAGSPASRTLVWLAFALGFLSMNKPHFAVLVGISELFFLREWRTQWSVPAALAAGALAPFGLLLALSPESFDALFTKMAAYHLSGNYDTYSQPLLPFLVSVRNVRLLAIGVVSLAFVAFAWRRGAIGARSACWLALLALASYAAFIQQQKFFRYHALPYLAISLGAAVFSVVALAERNTGRARLALLAVVGALLLTLQVSGLIGLQGSVRAESDDLVASALPFVSQLDGVRRIAILSPSVEGRLFTHTFGRDLEVMPPWTSNYTVGALLRIEDSSARRQAVTEYFEPIRERIDRDRPEIVAFSPKIQSLPPGSNLHTVFVEEYGLFPTPDYPLRKRYPNGWVVYRRRSPGSTRATGDKASERFSNKSPAL